MEQKESDMVKETETEAKTISNAATSTETKAVSGDGNDPIYSAQELADCSAKVFGQGVKSECVVAAFRSGKITQATKKEAVEIVTRFMKKEVK